MDWTDLIQWMLNFAFLSAFVWRHFQDKKVKTHPIDEKIRLAMIEADTRLRNWEIELKNSRTRFEEQTRSLESLTDQVNRLLKQGKLNQFSFPQSAEEQELKGALQSTHEPAQIPTLHQIENTKRRLKTESPLDLRTLLKDQLA